MNSKLEKLKKENQAVDRAMFMVYGTPDGKLMIDYLVRRFGGNLMKKTPDGAVDPYAMAASVGELNVIRAILEGIENGELARRT